MRLLPRQGRLSCRYVASGLFAASVRDEAAQPFSAHGDEGKAAGKNGKDRVANLGHCRMLVKKLLHIVITSCILY